MNHQGSRTDVQVGIAFNWLEQSGVVTRPVVITLHSRAVSGTISAKLRALGAFTYLLGTPNKNFYFVRFEAPRSPPQIAKSFLK